MTLSQLNVMVVEDHDFQRRTMLGILGNLGVGDLTEAADGSTALEQLHEGVRPDVMICDLDLPGVDGVALLRRIADVRPEQAVIIASGMDDTLLAAAGMTAKAHGLRLLGAVRKPLTADKLLELLAPYAEAAAVTDAPAAITVFEPQRDLVSAAPAGVWVTDPSVGSEALVAMACYAHRSLAGAGHSVVATASVGAGVIGERDAPDLLATRGALEGVAPRQLTIALHTSDVTAGGANAIELTARLRLKGFGVALFVDDLGALSQTVPHNELVLPPALWRNAGPGLTSVVQGARADGIIVTAAGCEDEADLTAAAALGCQRAHGAAVGRMEDAAALAAWASAQ